MPSKKPFPELPKELFLSLRTAEPVQKPSFTGWTSGDVQQWHDEHQRYAPVPVLGEAAFDRLMGKTKPLYPQKTIAETVLGAAPPAPESQGRIARAKDILFRMGVSYEALVAARTQQYPEYSERRCREMVDTLLGLRNGETT